MQLFEVIRPIPFRHYCWTSMKPEGLDRHKPASKSAACTGYVVLAGKRCPLNNEDDACHRKSEAFLQEVTLPGAK